MAKVGMAFVQSRVGSRRHSARPAPTAETRDATPAPTAAPSPPVVSLWTAQLLPEFLWLACLNSAFGWSQGTRIAWRVAEAASRERREEDDFLWWARASTYECLDDECWERIQSELTPEMQRLGQALGPLVALFPAVPMARLVPPAALPDAVVSRQRMASVVASLRDRESVESIRVQGNALNFAVLSGQILFPGDSAVERLPELRNYPDTPASREVGQAVRVMANALYGFSNVRATQRTWPGDAWASLNTLAGSGEAAK